MVRILNRPVESICMLRDLARAGRLADAVAGAAPAERAALGTAAYEIVWPVVYQHLTRGIELRRGHRRCATGVTRLGDECLDRFHDDVEAVVHDLLRNAHAEIINVEAWLYRRLNAATVDGNRRRRGRRGALQRPRMPGWLAGELGHDPWLIALALHILQWVGVPETAGAEVWPLDGWVGLRPGATGDWDTDVQAVRSEVDRVLAAMRRRPYWYTSYVERPLGTKIPPLAPAAYAAGDEHPLRPVTPDEEDDARLLRLAEAAIEAIAAGQDRGEDARSTVLRVIDQVFGAGAGGDQLTLPPDESVRAGERVTSLVSDPRVLDRIVAEIVGILAGRG